jgi:hypothetical protein
MSFAKANMPLPPTPKWWRILRSPRFGLRLLLLAITACALLLGWLGLAIQRARQQEATVKLMLARNCQLWFDCELNDLPPPTGAPPYPYRPPKRNVPQLLRTVLGDHFFIRPVSLDLYGPLQLGDIERVSTLSELRSLSIGASFSTNELVHLQRLPKLTSLRLCDSNVSDQDLAHLSRLTQLEDLSLGYTRINGSGLVHLREFHALTRLELEKTDVDDAGVSYLVGLPKLEELNLSESRVTDEGLKRLAEIPSLKKIDLTGTLITDASIPLIKRIQSRIDLVLWETEISLKGAATIVGSDTDDALRFGKSGPFSREGAVASAASGRRADRLRWLLQHGADPNRNDDGWTPLHMAAANGDVEMIRLLLAFHADTTIRNLRGITAREAAEENGQQKAVDLLEQSEE